MKKENLSCNVIQDLLPLYEDDCCSEDSRALVEAHLKECRTCQKKNQSFQTPLPPLPEIDPEAEKIKKGMRRIKFIRRLGISALALCLTLLWVIIPTINYVKDSGITYTNLREIHTAKEFLRALSQKDFEKAYAYYDIEKHYESLLSTSYNQSNEETEAILKGIAQIRENGFAWYDEIAKTKFLLNMHALDASKSYIVSYTFEDIYKDYDSWYITFRGMLENGAHVIIHINVDKNNIHNITFAPDLSDISEAVPSQQKIAEYLSFYYRRPTFNETILEIMYKETEYDWTILFDKDYDIDVLFDLE